MTNISFDAAAYAASLGSAVTGWKTADNRSGDVARHALAALVSSSLSPMAVAMTFYDAVQPTDAKGNKTSPKEADGVLRVRNLGQPHIAGSDGARKCLETVLYIFANRSYAMGEVEAFIIGGRKAMRLNPLKRFIEQAKAKAAKAEAEAAGAVAEVEPDAPDSDAPTTGDMLNGVLEQLRSIASLDDNIQLVALQAIAAEIDRLNATIADAPAEAAAA